MTEHIPYGIYRMRLIGPEAALNEFGPTTVTVKGSDLDNLISLASEAVALLAEPAWPAVTTGYDDLPDKFCPLEFAAPELTANQWQNVDGTQQWFVGVYEVGRCYGGPEEGGWWYDTGKIVRQTAVASRDEAEQVRETLRAKYPDTGASSNYHGGEDYRISINLEPHADYFPAEAPRYE